MPKNFFFLYSVYPFNQSLKMRILHNLSHIILEMNFFAKISAFALEFMIRNIFLNLNTFPYPIEKKGKFSLLALSHYYLYFSIDSLKSKDIFLFEKNNFMCILNYVLFRIYFVRNGISLALFCSFFPLLTVDVT